MKKSVLSIFLATLLLSTLVIVESSVSADSIKDLRKQIEEHEKEKSKLSEERNTIDSERSETEMKIDENLEEQDSVTQEIKEIENELTTTQNSITEKEKEIDSTNEEIDGLTERIDILHEEIEILEEKIEKRDVLLKDRLRSIQQNGGQGRYMEVIFGAKSFADFISRTSAVNTIMDQDQQIMEDQAADKELLTANKVEVEEKKETVVAKKEELEEQKQELLVLQGQLDEQKSERETLMAQLEEEHGELEEIKLTLDEEKAILAAEEEAQAQAIAQAQGRIGELEQLAREEEERKRKEEERRRKAQQTDNKKVVSAPKTSVESNTTPSTGGSGIFIHPVNAPINSPFGMRFHPIDRVNKLHAGIDYRAGTGTPLRAPADGVVSTARWMGGFGNVIMISHYINGQNYTTVSAHLSRMDVSPGQTVTQGQVIGATGNTGHSTGPHLHFEVHIGGYGNPVNPTAYLK